MKIYFIGILLLISGGLCSHSLYGHRSSEKIKVKIVEKDSSYPIVQALIQIHNKVYVSDAKGECIIELSPTDRVMHIHSLGYKPREISSFRGKKELLVFLDLEQNLLEEVVVSSSKQTAARSSVTQELTGIELSKNLGKSLAESLEKMKGVSFIQNGATVAKPVIQGMYGNRILIINNGVRQEGQAWGDDHAPEIDLNNASSVTIIKGVDAIRYGSQALGGIIRLEPKELPYNRTKIGGNLSTSYGSNGKRYALTGYLDGSLPFARSMAWRVQGTVLNGGDRKTAKYLLNNTGMREYDFSTALGYKKRDFSFDLFYSRYDSKIGVLYTAQRGDIDLLKERIKMGRPLEIEPFTRKIDYPYQQVIHQIFRVKSDWDINTKNQLHFQYSYQTDQRDEFHARRNNLSHIPSLSLDLSSSQLDLSWLFFPSRYLKTEVGIYTGFADNANKAGTGVVPIIPNYTQQNWGAFLLQRFLREKWSADAGIRFDRQSSKADGFNSYGERYGGKRTFANATYHLGGAYQISRPLRFVSNLGLAWRSPHVHELYSNGLDHASGIYVVGNSQLQPERSTKWISSFIYETKPLTLSIDGYLQWVHNYIYDEPSQDYMTIVSGTYPVFRYKQVDGFFRGIDAELSFTPFSFLTYTHKASMIWANEKRTGRYLPYIPSFHWLQTLGYELSGIPLFHKVGFTLKHKYVAKQKRFDPATDLISFTPPSYHLWGLGVEGSIDFKQKHRMTFLVEINNLLNKEYKEYTNRFRYYAHDTGRDIRMVCIWSF